MTTAAAPPNAPTPTPAPDAPRPPQRHVRRPPRRLLVALTVLTVLGGLTYFRWAPPSTAGNGVEAVGTLEAAEVTVAAEVTARLTAVTVEEGQQVWTGDVLARLDDSLPQLQRRVADPLNRQVMQLQLEKYTLRAPVDGVVLRRAAHPGEVAVAGAPLFTLGEGGRLDLTLYVLQRDLGKVWVGQRVIISPEALPGETAVGEVESVSSKAEFTPRNAQTPRDRLNQVFAVQVRVDGADARLKPGMTVSARLEG